MELKSLPNLTNVCLHEKFLKTRSEKRELEYKNYKNLFETIKNCSKKLNYSKLIVKYKENIITHGQ